MSATASYTVLMAIPFMPAVEIGLSMLILFGARIALLVYLSTLMTLMVSYVVGRVLLADCTARGFGLLGLVRAQRFVERMAPLATEERIALMTQESPARVACLFLRHRFLGLALLLNLPGNVVVGGGGGIALAAGMSGLYSFPAYLLTVACAVAPVPLIIALTEWL